MDIRIITIPVKKARTIRLRILPTGPLHYCMAIQPLRLHHRPGRPCLCVYVCFIIFSLVDQTEFSFLFINHSEQTRAIRSCIAIMKILILSIITIIITKSHQNMIFPPSSRRRTYMASPRVLIVQLQATSPLYNPRARGTR